MKKNILVIAGLAASGLAYAENLEGVDRISSRSVEGRTSVAVEIDSDYDPRELLDDIKGRVDAINVFPADTEKPVISLAQRSWAVISVVVAGDYSEEEIRLYAEHVRDDLLRSELKIGRASCRERV